MRSEEDKLTQSAIKVVLGGQTYEIRPLAIKYSMPWTKKVVDILMGVLPLTEVTSDDPLWASSLEQIMVARPEKLIDLLFEYAHDLKREEIEEVATSVEIVAAFEGVMSLEAPLLSMAMRAFMAATPKSDLERLLNTSSQSGISTPSR